MSTQKGYTIAELLMAIFIFGLIITFVLPLFEQIKADANDQAMFVEVNQWMVAKIEQLSSVCMQDQSGVSRRKFAYSKAMAQMKWECKKMNQWLMHLSVVVQWRNQKGELKTERVETHRFRDS